MDPEMRGSIEQKIDSDLEERHLSTYHRIFESYRKNGFIADIESALFAHIVTKANDLHLILLQQKYGSIDDVDWNQEGKEFETIILSKGAYIRSQIRKIVNK